MRDNHGLPIPLFPWMNKIPSGIVLIPLVLGSAMGTLSPVVSTWAPLRAGSRSAEAEKAQGQQAEQE